ncbi:MAG: HD domain-containing protein [Candidatus Omnitrophota bacterium]|nr:HD domain-containing protein [Candidatus Omnitrophota bacterium]
MPDIETRLLSKMEGYFAEDAKRIRHARAVLGYAKEILEKEKGDREVVIPAAILHDIGIKECEKKYNSTAGHLQEKEGPPIATGILHDLNVDEEIISEVCQIIASHHSPGEIDTANFRILWDADWLVNLRDEYDINDREKLKDVIKKVFLTATGRSRAEEIYIKNEKNG